MLACPKCHTALCAFGDTPPPCCPSCAFPIAQYDGVPSFLEGEESDATRASFEASALLSESSPAQAMHFRSMGLVRSTARSFQRLRGSLDSASTILDVGCGNGLLAEMIGAPFPTVGVDYSLGMCRAARARGIFAVHASALKLPFPNNSFDLVCCSEVIHYYDDVSLFLTELARVTKPGGRVIISAPNSESALRKITRNLRNTNGDPVIHGRSIETLLDGTPKPLLEPENACWMLFPFPQVRKTSAARWRGNAFATNFAVSYLKQA